VKLKKGFAEEVNKINLRLVKKREDEE